jgi:virginiamycin B lyase
VTTYLIPTRHSGPSGIAVGPDGNIWFTETNVNQLGTIDVHSDAIREIPLPVPGSAPFGIVTGPDNNLWITESAGNKLARYTPSVP